MVVRCQMNDHADRFNVGDDVMMAEHYALWVAAASRREYDGCEIVGAEFSGFCKAPGWRQTRFKVRIDFCRRCDLRLDILYKNDVGQFIEEIKQLTGTDEVPSSDGGEEVPPA